MVFAFFLCIASLLLVHYVVTEKALHPLEHIFIWLLFVAVFITFVDLATPKNSEMFTIKHEWTFRLGLRLNEIIIVPLIMLFYLEQVHKTNTFIKNVINFVVFLLILLLNEWLLKKLNVIDPKEWNDWWSIPNWTLWLIFSFIMQRLFRKLLIKEGVIH
ncbi:hypothetical protein J2S09_005114 [Bacillus fengqiuensis]|nr:hypothetical protein [Bacillus fengqiuensis]